MIILKTLYVSAVCGAGLKRQNNEDNLCINDLYLDEQAVAATRKKAFEYAAEYHEPLLASVFDGIGGEMAGEAAAAMAARALSSDPVYHTGELHTRLRSITSALCCKARQLGTLRIGCTAAILAISGETATVVNIGDSRVYRLRKNRLEQLSHDQSEVQAYIDAGLISKRKARLHPRRHLITNFLGLPENDLVFEKAKTLRLQSGDVFLLCSDGLTECLDDRKIRSMLRSGSAPLDLYNEAMAYGGVDNTTIILIRVE